MRRRRLVTFITAGYLAVAACARNQQDKAYYDAVERGSRWQLTLDQTPCSITASTIAVDVPSGVATGVPAGCAATLMFYLNDDGDVTPSYDCTASFRMTCSDGSWLSCDQLLCEDHQTMFCWSTSAGGADTCELGATLDRIQ